MQKEITGWNHILKNQHKIDETLTNKLKGLLENVLKEVLIIEERNVKVQSFHAKIGRWNTIFTDSIRIAFSNPQDFINDWLQGLLNKIKEIETDQLEKYDQTYPNTSAHRTLKFYKNTSIREYIEIFLERNFYRNYKARTRKKPKEQLWELWFGNGTLNWGIFITPVKRSESWTNDVSEIRRVEFSYWTVGHILETGLIDPENDEIVTFESVNDLLKFYRQILKRVSCSKYEKAIYDLYEKYIKESNAQFEEPFLIPELRYAGLEKKHKYRLDFTILNSHTMKLTGFEISPSSSHMSVSGIRNKSQQVVNDDIAKSWTKEVEKRNDYFKKYEIPIVTFTEHHLQNIEDCFKQIKEVLGERSPHKPKYDDLIDEVDSYTL